MNKPLTYKPSLQLLYYNYSNYYNSLLELKVFYSTRNVLTILMNHNSVSVSFLLADVNRKCWYMTTKGMHAVGQAEVVVLLQCLPDEKSIPKDIFSHFVQLYRESLTGKLIHLHKGSRSSKPIQTM